jgi:hypothetical protein
MSTPRPLRTGDLARADARTAREDRPDSRSAAPPPDTSADSEDEASPLFASESYDALWRRWDAIQRGFVDEPRRAVEEADSLVAETMKHLAETFSQARANLEQQWGRGDDVSTEDVRVALRGYCLFFKRLLSVWQRLLLRWAPGPPKTGLT